MDLRETGSVVGWGSNVAGEATGGAPSRVQDRPVLAEVLESRGVVDLACGRRYSLAVDENGNLFSWGTGNQGQLGHGEGVHTVSQPKQVLGLLAEQRVVAIAASQSMAAAVSESGELFEWGLLHYVPKDTGAAATLEMHGMARRHHSEKLKKLVRASELRYLMSRPEDEVGVRGASPPDSATETSSSDSASLIPESESRSGDSEGEVKGEEGVLNLRTRRAVVPLPKRSIGLEGRKVASVALGAAHVAVITSQGVLFTKGYNDRGQLGAGHRISRASFEAVVGPINDTQITKVLCGSAHCIALDITGRLWGFGTNPFGQLGLGPSKGEQLTPVPIDLLQDERVVQVATGEYHSLCLTDKGEIFSWGHAEYGQHGGGKEGSDLSFAHFTRHYHSPRRLFPFARSEDSDETAEDETFVQVASIASNASYSFAVDISGRIWSWGWNGDSVLGHGAGAGWTSPRCVEDVPNVIRIAAGPNHVLALVRQTGSQFALSYSHLLPKASNHELGKGAEHDLVLKSRPSARQQDASAASKLTVPAHKFLVFARCPAMKRWFVKTGPNEPDQVQLPVVLAPLVLYALVEYLYCDHVRSCPPHRLIDLQHLGEQLQLTHLVEVCVFGRYQRDFKLVANNSFGNRTVPPIPKSTFTRDLLRCLDQTWFHNIVLEAIDEEDEPEQTLPSDRKKTPPGHTVFSWSTALPFAVGHTPFSASCMQNTQSADLAVLCRYPFFDRLLMGSFRESVDAVGQGKPVQLHNLSREGLDVLVRWMYSGDRTAVLDPNTVMSVLATALCFGIDDLAQVCEKYIYESIDKENATIVLEFAQDVGNARLAFKAKQFIE